MLFPCSSVGSLPCSGIWSFLNFLECEPLPWVSVLLELLQHGSFPWCCPSGRVTAPDRKPAPAAAFHELQPSHALPTCSGMAPPRLQCECVTPWSFMGCSGTAFLTMVFSMGLGHVLPSLLADLGICSVFSCIFLTPLWHSCCTLVFNLFKQCPSQHCW